MNKFFQLGIALGSPYTGNHMHKVCPNSISDVESYVKFYKGFSLTVPDKFNCLPYFQWLQKLHKTPYGSRLIGVSSSCPTTLVSKILTACLGLVRKRQQVYYEAIYRNSSVKGHWLIQNSEEVSDLVSEANSKGNIISIKTYDFSTLYTNLPHTELKERVHKLVSESFEGLDKKYISIDRNLWAHWTNTKRQSMLLLTPRKITKMLHFLLDNVYIQVGDHVFQQCIGIPIHPAH